MPNIKDGKPNVKASPDRWLRSGNALADFTFRVPDSDAPLCIGAKTNTSDAQAKLVKIMDSRPYTCRFLRFSLFIASRKAEGVVWLNGGFHGKNQGAYTAYAGAPIPKRMSWTPVLLQVGPVDKEAGWVHFGVAISKGDVWFVQPKFEVIADSELSARRRKDEELCLSSRPKNFFQERSDAKL
jgi:hypothetical protein